MICVEIRFLSRLTSQVQPKNGVSIFYEIND